MPSVAAQLRSGGEFSNSYVRQWEAFRDGTPLATLEDGRRATEVLRDGRRGSRRVTPEMSVVLVTDVMESIDGVLATFRRQTIAGRLELVLATAPETVVPDDVGLGFAAATVVRVEDPTEVSSARAACVLAATAPVVAVGETHCMPEPDWCELLLAAFHDPAVAVAGSRMLCANPQTTLSLAAHLMDYGPWADGPRGPRLHLPAHNVAYRRDLLLEAGADLAAELEVDAGLNDRVLTDGMILLFEPRARAHHLDVSRPRAWFQERFFNGRTYAGQRALHWGWPRRLAYGLAWPLIPVVRFVRLIRLARSADVSGRAVPALVVALTLASAGEGTGYLLGPGGAPAWRRRLEIEKGRHVRTGEATAALERVLAKA